ncbi:hypothetical protein CR513_09450, partial [Mucuna pruriens]
MSRFLNGLNKKIQDIVELHHYSILKGLVHPKKKCMKRVISHAKKVKKSLCKVQEKDGGLNVYYDWEMKVEQNLEYFDYEDMIKIKLITLAFEGSRSVEEYFKEMENLKKPLWLCFCMVLTDKFKMLTIHQATTVELQLKRHGKSYSSTSSNWKGKERREERPKRDKSPKKGSAPSQGRKEEVTTSTPALLKQVT